VKVHQLEWTPERVQAFWDHYSAIEAHADLYFSRVYGRSLIAYVRRRIRIGVPLDFGCGRGDLLAYLAEAGCKEVHGAEQSPESRAAAARKIGDRAELHLSAATEPESADTAFIVEVVEHLDDQALKDAFAQIHRALKPGGHVVITTPNAENLEANEVLCPECFATFHVMQHVRSWDASSLSAFAERQGFETVNAEATILSPHTGLLDRLWRSAKLYTRARPNLVYIGRKVQSPASRVAIHTDR
jgi:SAM-dependent methyltransferase